MIHFLFLRHFVLSGAEQSLLEAVQPPYHHLDVFVVLAFVIRRRRGQLGVGGDLGGSLRVTVGLEGTDDVVGGLITRSTGCFRGF